MEPRIEFLMKDGQPKELELELNQEKKMPWSPKQK